MARKQSNRRPVEQKISIARENTDIRIATGNIDVIWSKIPKWLTADLDLKADNLKLKLGYAPSHEITAKSLTININPAESIWTIC
nr:hypothetical protein HAGR004_40110 [Bdellovibrio sp. HAGR004]